MKNKFLFVLCTHSSGSTLLWKLLQTSPNVSAFNIEGQSLDGVRHLMRPDRWNPEKEIPWGKIRKEWYQNWDIEKPVLLEKSPPNLIRAKEIEKVFQDAYFVIMVRNPYAYCEGTKRRWLRQESYSTLAESWIDTTVHQIQNIQSLNNVIQFTYEEFADNPNSIRKRLLEFLPELESLDFGISTDVHSIYGKNYKQIQNLNPVQISNLRPENVAEITGVLKNHQHVVDYFGYKLIKPPSNENTSVYEESDDDLASKFPNLMIICVDSMRPESVGYNKKHFNWFSTFPYRANTPTLDGIARRGVYFPNLFVQAPFTPSSHASFFTGLNPPNHNLRGFFGYQLSTESKTLAETAKNNGYSTAAIIGADALSTRFGIDRGFDIYDTDYENKMETWLHGQYRRTGKEVTIKTNEFLRNTKKPFFVFAHYFDVHGIAAHIVARSDPAFRFARRVSRIRIVRKAIRKSYSQIKTQFRRFTQFGKPYHLKKTSLVDSEIDSLITTLKKCQLYDNTIIVIMSDHGDAFGEHHEKGHRDYVYDTTLRVPLIIAGGGLPEGVIVDDEVRSIDLVPTLYELLRLTVDTTNNGLQIDGRSVLPLIRGEDEEVRNIYSETRKENSLDKPDDLGSHLIAYRKKPWKIIVNLITNQTELYQIEDDPNEFVNMAMKHPEVRDRLFEEAMEIYRREEDAGYKFEKVTDDERNEIEKRLIDLGYL